MSKELFRPLSLAQHFEPPDGYRGHFGWVCGYTADTVFLNDAAERFTGSTGASRAHAGEIILAVILDPRVPQLSLEHLPGVLHLPLRSDKERPFRLMHAKVALLGYRSEREESWLVRLLVSTGNWTRETLESNLDLVWVVDVPSEELRARPDRLARQACADVRAAADLLRFLREHFDERLLGGIRPGESPPTRTSRLQNLQSWTKQASEAAGGAKPRFVDNRHRSLLDQLPRLVQRQAGGTKRNYLAMGSGFFEKAEQHNYVPKVLRQIVTVLQENELLTTGNPEIDVFINPDACQAVADSVCMIKDAGWSVRAPGMPDCLSGRKLHAKFLFGGNHWNNSNNCNSPWVYVGSGNLTGPGFAKAMHRDYGNLEAGVVFEPEEKLYWYGGRDVSDACVVTNLLPLQWDHTFNESGKLDGGPEMPEPTEAFVAPPIAWVWWRDGFLQPHDENAAGYEILDENGRPCERDDRGWFCWNGAQPRQIRVRWAEGRQHRVAFVAVIDQHGRIAAGPLTTLELEDAWNRLASFPLPPDEEEVPDDAAEHVGRSGAPGAAPSKSQMAQYPIRAMMELIENIADKQTSILKWDWTTWCARLEQCLGQAASSEILARFRELKLNPISPLWQPPFRSDFAATDQTDEGKMYEAALRRIEAEWQVNQFARIGGNHDQGLPRLAESSQTSPTTGE